MTNLLRRYRVGTRLSLAFGTLLVLLVAIAAVGLSSMSSIQSRLDNVALHRGGVTTAAEKLFDYSGQIADVARDAVLDPQSLAGAQDSLHALREQYREARAELEQFSTDAEGLQLRRRVDLARADAAPLIDSALEMVGSDGAADAGAFLNERVLPAVAEWRTPLREILILQTARNEQDHAAAVAAYEAASTTMQVLGALALALGAWLAWSITRSLTVPLQTANQVARDIAQGALDGAIEPDGRDEISALLRSMKEMQSELQAFAEAQAEISRQHEAGEVDHRIPADRFPGAYGRMAAQVNALVESHIEAVLSVSAFVADYARGDLSRDFPELPGKKVVTTRAVAAIKANMQATNEAVAELVEAANAGDFSRRGDAARFEYTYREVIESLNRLMAGADRGLRQVSSVMNAVAEGDLQRRADETLPGQFGELAADANRTVEKLAEIVGQIRQGSDAMNAAAGEIAAGNNDLSRRTEQQAASLEETASSMEELTSTVQHNADNARRANELARGAAEVAGKGGQVVGQVVRTMDGINEASRRIVDIIGVIDGIAFQTNILALNAAVEAARAGEQGRGFAVVASEVRSLAQRSAAAAKEIKVLIDDSVSKVEDGSSLVHEAGSTMEEIVSRVAKVSEIISEIAAASAEQSAGIEQVSQAMVQMDEGTQQNAALVEEASAAARALEQQAGALVHTVAIFRADSSADLRTGTNPEPAAQEPRGGVLPLPGARPVPRQAPAERSPAPAPLPRAAGGGEEWQEF